MSTSIGQHWEQVSQREDLLGADFIARTFSFQGLKNPTHTTLIHHIGRPRTAKAILYVHGYTDYFFQTGLAEYFIELGYRFYAVDLQGYGRSIRPSTPPNWCDTINQYNQDLDIALATMRKDGVKKVVMLGHSTGGLVISNYLAQPHTLSDRESHYDKAFPEIIGVALNSPFLALPLSPRLLNKIHRPIYSIVSTLPFISIKTKKATVYAKTVHSKFGGEWDYRLDWKPEESFGLRFHWLKEIMLAQRALANRKIKIPTLLCRSEISTIGEKTVDKMQQGDGVLNVESMQKAAEATFSSLDQAIIPKGFHDLYLSHEPARELYLSAIKNWLKTLQ